MSSGERRDRRSCEPATEFTAGCAVNSCMTVIDIYIGYFIYRDGELLIRMRYFYGLAFCQPIFMLHAILYQLLFLRRMTICRFLPVQQLHL
jgi:hypothetical protein